MNNIIPFNFNDHSVRIIDQNGEPWFVLSDVCRVLELDNPSYVAKRLDDDERRNPSLELGLRKDQILINESGMYSLVLRSDKPSAKPFRRWVTRDVIPSIRKTGGYQAKQPPIEDKQVMKANTLFKSNLSISKLVFKGNQALLSANAATMKSTDIDVLGNIGASHLIAEKIDWESVSK